MEIKKICEFTGLNEQIIKDIQHYYSEPHRSYHSWNHIIQGIKEFNFIEDNKIFKISSEMKIAWLFHDIVYLPFNNTLISNEELSLRFLEFYNNKKMKLSFELIEEAKKLIKSTENHKAYDENSAIFLDVDMSYLGADYDIFLNIRKKVREEYSGISDIDFAKGTINFYETMLKKEKIFQSTYGLNKYEEKSRQNILNDLNEQEKKIKIINKLKL